MRHSRVLSTVLSVARLMEVAAVASTRASAVMPRIVTWLIALRPTSSPNPMDNLSFNPAVAVDIEATAVDAEELVLPKSPSNPLL